MINELLLNLKEYTVLLSILLGVASSISPCMFATNIAALSYIIANNPKKSIFIGVMFSLGRIVTYFSLGIILIIFGKEMGQSQYFNMILGVLLVIIGYMFLDIFTIDLGFTSKISQKGLKYKDYGVAGAFILGLLFALAFCPYSAALFFGILIPLGIKSSFGISYPILFGIGVSIPIMIFSFIIYFGFSTKLNALTENWEYVSKSLGSILLIVGIYYVKTYINFKVGFSVLILSVFLIVYKITSLKTKRKYKVESHEIPEESKTHDIFKEIEYLDNLNEDTIRENFQEVLSLYTDLEIKISKIEDENIKKRAEKETKRIVDKIYEAIK